MSSDVDKTKQWVLLTAVACLAVLAAGWFLLVSPKRAAAADLREQTAAAVTANRSAATKLAVLKAQAKDLPAQQAELAQVAAKIPADPALPALIRALDAAAQDSGVELLALTPGAPTSGDAAPGAPAPQAVEPAAPTAAGAGSGTAKKQLLTIPVELSVAGGYFEVQQFVASVEDLPRALRLTDLKLEPAENPVVKDADARAVDEGRSLIATLSGRVFMSSAAAAPAAPTAPAPAAAAAPAN